MIIRTVRKNLFAGKVQMRTSSSVRLLIAFLSLLLVSVTAHAACHAVTPTGSGNKSGADWNNAMAGLPATLVRGDMYYLADGQYPSYSFTTPNSGTTTITIKKAQSWDNGQSCSPSIAAGWNAGTIGAAQAVFGTSGPDTWLSAKSTAGYYTVDGNGQSTAPGCGTITGATASDCGIKFNVGCSTAGQNCSGMDFNNGPSNVAFKSVEVVGHGHSGTVNEHHWFLGSAAGQITLTHIYDHDSESDFIQNYTTPLTVEYSYFQRNGSGACCHGQFLWSNRASGTILRYNVWEDIQGTADITVGSAGQPGANDNWQIYGNVLWSTPSPGSSYQCMGWGFIGCINSNSCSGWKIYNNSIVDLKAQGTLQCGASQAGINDGDSGSAFSNTLIENNLWYGNAANVGFTLSGSGNVENYNSFLNGGSGSGAQDITNGSASNPFVSWTTHDFHLSGENSNWTGGLSLASPYNLDPGGTVRGADGTWDRGAYEYPPNPTKTGGGGGGGSTAPASPTGLSALVQ